MDILVKMDRFQIKQNVLNERSPTLVMTYFLYELQCNSTRINPQYFFPIENVNHQMCCIICSI